MTTITTPPIPPPEAFPYESLRGDWKKYALPSDYSWSKEAKDKQISERAQYILKKVIADIFDPKNSSKRLASLAISVALFPLSIIVLGICAIAACFFARHRASQAVKGKIADQRLEELKIDLNNAASTGDPISFKRLDVLPAKLQKRLLSINNFKDDLYKNQIMVEIQRHLENNSLDSRTKLKQLQSGAIFEKKLNRLNEIIDEFENQIKDGPAINYQKSGPLNEQMNRQYMQQLHEIKNLLEGDMERVCPNVVIDGQKYDSWNGVRTRMELLSATIASNFSIDQNELNNLLNYLTTQAATSLLTGPLVEVASEPGTPRNPKECFVQKTDKANDWKGDIEFRFENNTLEVKYKMELEFKHLVHNVSVGTGVIIATLKIDNIPKVLESLPKGKADFSFIVEDTSIVRPSSTPVKPNSAVSSSDSSSPNTTRSRSNSEMTTDSKSPSPSSHSPLDLSSDEESKSEERPILLPNNGINEENDD